LFWGTYDLSKPRNRILLRGLRECGVHVQECHESVWEAVRDKSVIGSLRVAIHLLKAMAVYPRLLARFLRAERPDLVVIGYLGQLDVILLAPVARLLHVPVVWDQFLSLYDTVVEDRAIVSARHPIAFLLYLWEWLACRFADCVLLDTRAHAAYVRRTFRLDENKVDSVWVGVEPDVFPPGEVPAVPDDARELRVLFYGQFIALHGVETIVHAARLLEGERIRFSLIGTGQEEARIRRLIAEHPLPNLTWEPWVDYEHLVERIHAADVCLGIFGNSGKAERVIPNKIFQIVSARRPLVTRDSAAIREMFEGQPAGVWLVPGGDGPALAEQLRALSRDRARLPAAPHAELAASISPRCIGEQALKVLHRVVARDRPVGFSARHGRS
jgi:glycosyltransferase involved in cell wall biosynthesis